MANVRRMWPGCAVLAIALLAACGEDPAPIDYSGPTASWPEWGGDKGGLKWSPLTQITRDNVRDLEVAWTYHHGDISDGTRGITRSSFNATPIIGDDTLYFCTGMNRVIALDPESGEEKWSFDPQLQQKKLQGPYPLVCRGVAQWQSDESAKACNHRIFTATIDSELIALDGETGIPCSDFGKDGRVALREGLGDVPPWEYYVTSPPLVIRDVVVVGALVADNVRSDAPAGVVRAFDVHTGALRWAFDPVPPEWSANVRRNAGEKYTAGTPNVWSILSGDAERGLVFVPTGNAAPDYYAGDRKGLDYYSSSVVALDADTGAVRWHFQTVHHDHWDYDVPAQPALFQIEGVGDGRAGVAQITKMGRLFLLDRATGEPLYPVEERPAPQGAVPGDVLSPTQPYPTHPAPLSPETFTPADAWGFTPWDRQQVRRQDREHALGRDLHAARSRADHRVSRQRGRTELGRRLDRPDARRALRQLDARAERRAAAAARGVRQARSVYRAVSGDARADARHAVRIAHLAAARAARRAVQSAAVGRDAGGGPQERQAALGVATRHHARSGAVPDVAAARRAESRRLDRDGGRPRLHRRHHRQVPARLRRRDGRGDLERAPALYRERDAAHLPAAQGRAPVRGGRLGRPRLVGAG